MGERPIQIVDQHYIAANGHKHHIEVAQAAGGGDSFNLRIDNFYCGTFIHYSTGWTPMLNTDILYSEDIQEILAMIKERCPY